MGALKAEDVISVRSGISDAPSVAGQGLATSQTASPRTDGKADALAEKHNFVTIKLITTDNSPHRVYNLEVESRDGEITHNYFVGEDELWVHNLGFGKFLQKCNAFAIKHAKILTIAAGILGCSSFPTIDDGEIRGPSPGDLVQCETPKRKKKRKPRVRRPFRK